MNAKGVNAEGGTGFAGHADWRIPNVRELQSIVDFGRSFLALDPVFNTGCEAGCTVTTCSCSHSVYWSSTTHANDADDAWYVEFVTGSTLSAKDFGFPKTGCDPMDISCPNHGLLVRAVRGGF